MVFYVMLLLVSIIVAAVVVWLYRAVESASRKTYRSILPSSNEGVSVSAMEGVTQSRRRAVDHSTPWGWKKSKGAEDRVSVAVPVHNRQQTVGWPYRDEPFSFDSGESANTNRRVSKSRKSASSSVDKPWGW